LYLASLAPKMEGGLRGIRSLSHIYGRLGGPPTIRGLVRFKNGVEFIRDFSVLDYLAPYDVLIGRDILREGRMYIDGSLSALFPEPNGFRKGQRVCPIDC
jgi:hypothetical protein